MNLPKTYERMRTMNMTSLLREAADYIDDHGWTQGAMERKGQVCLTGALRACSPQPGDWHLAAAVLRKRDRAEDWNDEAERTEAEVTAYLRTADVTDADLADTFGPQWESIVAMVRRAAILTEEEAKALDAARRAARNVVWRAARHAARNVAWYAARDAALDDARHTALGAALDAAWYAARNAARNAARDAATALAVRDLIGQHGFTQDHYDTLTRPWRTVIGPLHPEDKEIQK